MTVTLYDRGIAVDTLVREKQSVAPFAGDCRVRRFNVVLSGIALMAVSYVAAAITFGVGQLIGVSIS